MIDARPDSELARWDRLDPHHNPHIMFIAPDDDDLDATIGVDIDDPVDGYLVHVGIDGDIVSRLIVDDRELATDLVHEIASEIDRYQRLRSTAPDPISEIPIDPPASGSE